MLLFAVSKAHRFLKYWLPVLLWMALIFSASSDRMSFQHSSRIIEPLVRWLVPNISDTSVHTVVVVARKAAHVTEYAILAVLVWRLVRQLSSPRGSSGRWSDALRTLLIVILYAASDEFHQLFVPSREASVVDVAIDTSGAVLALLFIGVLARWRQRW
jgi:VanZ family protein